MGLSLFDQPNKKPTSRGIRRARRFGFQALNEWQKLSRLPLRLSEALSEALSLIPSIPSRQEPCIAGFVWITTFWLGKRGRRLAGYLATKVHACNWSYLCGNSDLPMQSQGPLVSDIVVSTLYINSCFLYETEVDIEYSFIFDSVVSTYELSGISRHTG